MRVAIIGSGPTGLMLGAALARRGHQVVSVDRDGGPAADGTWHRRGVMQFEHAHGFRAHVGRHLAAGVARGARPVGAPGSRCPSGSSSRASVRCSPGRSRDGARSSVPCGSPRRTCPVSRSAPATSTRWSRTPGGARHRRRRGCRPSRPRRGRLRTLRPFRCAAADVESDCGMAYVDRTYQLLPGAEPGPMSNPVGHFGVFDGYQTLIFPHEGGPLLGAVRAAHRRPGPQGAAARGAVRRGVPARSPACPTWTDPSRSRPTGPVLVGGALRNVFRPQAGRRGLVAVGDSVTTTTPTAGRGIAMCAMQIDAFLGMVDAGASLATIEAPFGAWCDEHMRPWVDDHVDFDTEAVRRGRAATSTCSCP